VPDDAFDAVRQVMQNGGLELTTSLWDMKKQTWLDGGCDGQYPKCNLYDTKFVISNFKTLPSPSPSPTPSPSPSPPRPPSPSPSTCSPAYGQCGGTGWGGPTCCIEGYTCDRSQPSYQQCKPSSSKAFSRAQAWGVQNASLVEAQAAA